MPNGFFYIFYYISIQISSVLFRSLYYYRPGLITLTTVESKVLWQLRFFTSTTVVHNHFAEGSQILTYNFVRGPN